MKRILTSLRILGLYVRQVHPEALKPVLVQRPHVEEPAAATAVKPRRPLPRFRVRVRLNLQWSPLVNLANLALAGK
jgi:hypothetical protein